MKNSTIPDGSSQIHKSQNDKPLNKKTIIKGQEEQITPKGDEIQTQIVGFLVSYSRSDIGEYWILREGNKNKVGSGEDCQIQLLEATVSQNHATITIRRSKNDNRLMVVINDNNSSNGVTVNGNDIEYRPFECNSLDKIKIGNYELLLIIVDKISHNLSKSEIFKSLPPFDYSSKQLYTSNGTKI